MSSYLDKIGAEYEKAEITCLFVKDRKTEKCYNLFTIIELVPSEQESSSIIGTSKTSFTDRKSLDTSYSLHIGRVIDCNVETAVSIYRNAADGFNLECNSTLCRRIQLFENGKLESDPPSEYPLIINNQTEHTIGTILPHRHTAFRVWTKIDRDKAWLSKFNSRQKEKLFKSCGELTLQYMGFDLLRLPEHTGNFYLCCCNPYVRNYNCTLLDYDRSLLISFNEREGKSIIGKKIVLEDERAGNLAFSIERTISSIHEKITLPHFPDKLITKIYDTSGYVLENHSGIWMNISFQMQVQTSVLNLTVKNGNEAEVLEIPKFATQKPATVGKYDKSLAYYLKGQQRNREIEQLESRKEFIFFPGTKKDKEKARNIVGEILNRATKRCMLLDPYFGAGDLFFAYIIHNTSVTIQILSSSAFLKDKVNKSTTDTHATLLLKGIDQFQEKFPAQKIECKVLTGRDKSPLHDRYIVTDDSAYLLGSSFNEFGSRATTLIKVPAPELLIKKAMEWWTDITKSVILSEFVK